MLRIIRIVTVLQQQMLNIVREDKHFNILQTIDFPELKMMSVIAFQDLRSGK